MPNTIFGGAAKGLDITGSVPVSGIVRVGGRQNSEKILEVFGQLIFLIFVVKFKGFKLQYVCHFQ